MLMVVIPDTALNMEPIRYTIPCCSDLSVCSGGTMVIGMANQQRGTGLFSVMTVYMDQVLKE